MWRWTSVGHPNRLAVNVRGARKCSEKCDGARTARSKGESEGSEAKGAGQGVDGADK